VKKRNNKSKWRKWEPLNIKAMKPEDFQPCYPLEGEHLRQWQQETYASFLAAYEHVMKALGRDKI